MPSWPAHQAFQGCTASRQHHQGLHFGGQSQVKDHTVSMADNDRFLDTLEAYFGQTDQDKQPDIRAELSYQVTVDAALCGVHPSPWHNP